VGTIIFTTSIVFGALTKPLSREFLDMYFPTAKYLEVIKMDIMQAFTTGLKLDTLMLLDAFAGGTMKIKTVVEVQEKIDNMSLNEYRGHTEEEATPKKKGMIVLKTQDALLASNKLLSIQLETLAKRLEAREVAQLSAKVTCDFQEKAHESGACLPASLGFSK